MRFVTASQMRQLDKLAIQRYDIPSIILMENAGRAVADEVARRIRSKKAQVALFCGIGNNGGDGFVTARHLHNRGFKPIVFFFENPKNMKLDPQVNFKILQKMKVSLNYCSRMTNWKSVSKMIQKCHTIVDALFGIGLRREIAEPYYSAIQVMNNSRAIIVSVDIPSGLNADTGEVMGICVRAKATVTLGLPKKGFSLKRAHRFTKRVVVADISIPKEVLEQFYDFDT